MQRTMKRIGALMLALAMLVTFMPMLGLTEQAHADEEEGITVYLTVSDKGVIAKDNDGGAMAWREVTVTDLDSDGKYSFDEAIKAAHKQYNSEDGYVASTGGWVTKLWGVEDNPGSYSFIRNNRPTDLVTITYLEENDYLVVSVNKDGDTYSDYASFFDVNEKIVPLGESFDLTLEGFGAMTVDEAAPIEDVEIGIWKDGVFETLEETTDSDGEVSLSFDELGTYIVTASGVVKDAVSSVYATPSGQRDGKYYCSRTDWSTMDSYILYTEEDYGDGPYPKDEIKEIDFYDWMDLEEEEQDEYNLVYANNYVDQYQAYYPVLVDAPIIAPCCIVNVLDAEDVYVTVNNKGALASDKDGEAMVEREVTVLDLDGDGEFTVEEALIAAHEQYFEDGKDGYEYGDLGGYNGVKKLWGVETSNTLFLVDGVGIGTGVKDDTIESDQLLYASVNSDDKYYADFVTQFDDTYSFAKQNEDITVHLTGHLGMGYTEEELEDKDLEGIQIGYWEDGEFVAIPGAVTDENGEATFFLDEVGDYIITAKGTVKKTVTDYSEWPDVKIVEADCPIMAPYCFLEIEKASSTSTFDKMKAEAFSDLFDTFDPAKYRSKDQVTVLSLLVKAQAKISAAGTSDEIAKAVQDATAELEKITTDAEYKKQEAAFKKLKIKGVKVKAGKKKVTVTWKKAAVDGYEITCKAGKTKKAVIKKAATVKKVIKGLKSKKKCTTKIRGFKTIGGKKVYTAWTKAKTVKVK